MAKKLSLPQDPESRSIATISIHISSTTKRLSSENLTRQVVKFLQDNNLNFGTLMTEQRYEAQRNGVLKTVKVLYAVYDTPQSEDQEVSD